MNIQNPFYYHREYKNDFLKKISPVWLQQSKRVALVALPFLSLYRPVSFPLTLVTGTLRVANNFTNLGQVINSINLKENKQQIAYVFLQTAISVIALGSTIFAHPLGMLFTTGQDIILEVSHLNNCLKKKNYQEALLSCGNIINNALYLALFTKGTLEIMVASLAIQIAIGIFQARKDFKSGRYLEGAAQLLMAGIRGKQLSAKIKLLQTKLQVEKSLKSSPKTRLDAQSTPTTPNQTTSPEKIDPALLIAYKQNPHGWPALHYAIDQGRPDIALLFLEMYPEEVHQLTPGLHIVDVPFSDTAGPRIVGFERGFSALELSVQKRYLELSAKLLQKGADPNVVRNITINKCNWNQVHDWPLDEHLTPLYWAIKNDDLSMVQLLLNYQAKTEMIFSTSGYWETFKEVNHYGYEVVTTKFIRDYEQFSALKLASRNNNESIMRSLISNQMSKHRAEDIPSEVINIFKGLESNSANLPALHQAVTDNSIETCKILLEYVDPNEKRNGISAFQIALQDNKDDLGHLLIQKGSNREEAFYAALAANKLSWVSSLAEGMDKNGPALKLAIKQHQIELVKTLLQLGFRDEQALKIALEENQSEIAGLFLRVCL